MGKHKKKLIGNKAKGMVERRACERQDGTLHTLSLPAKTFRASLLDMHMFVLHFLMCVQFLLEVRKESRVSYSWIMDHTGKTKSTDFVSVVCNDVPAFLCGTLA